MKFRPMLAGKCTDVEKLRYPVLVSKKLDGIRCMTQDGVLMSRTLKPIPNKNVQALFAGLPEGLDGELIVGDPCAKDAYRKTVSLVMSDDKPLDFFGNDRVCFWMFDKFGSEGFKQRLLEASVALATASVSIMSCSIVQHVTVNSAEELDTLEAAWLNEGNEGVMIRSINGPYKQGRSSENEGYLLKLKRFEDAEAVVIGMEELEHNDNVATKNALGRTERSSAKAGKRGGDTMGKLLVRGINGPWDGVEFKIGSGFDTEQRADAWFHGEKLNGAVVKYKYFSIGSKDKPRHPIFLGWRDRRDM